MCYRCLDHWDFPNEQGFFPLLVHIWDVRVLSFDLPIFRTWSDMNLSTVVDENKVKIFKPLLCFCVRHVHGSFVLKGVGLTLPRLLIQATCLWPIFVLLLQAAQSKMWILIKFPTKSKKSKRAESILSISSVQQCKPNWLQSQCRCKLYGLAAWNSSKSVRDRSLQKGWILWLT